MTIDIIFFKAFLKWNALIKTFFAILLICSLLIPFSCTKEINLAFNEKETIVVNSVFNPDSTFTFYFSSTSSPLNEYSLLNKKLQFSLLENGKLLLDTTMLPSILKTHIFPYPNKVYNFHVKHEDFAQISAIDSIPRLVFIKEAEFIYPDGMDKYGDYFAGANITFSDTPNERNYYELLIWSKLNSTEKVYWSTGISTLDKVLLNEGDLDYFPTSFFFSDELFDGEIYTIKVKKEGFSKYQQYDYNSGIFATLRSVSQSFYLYRKYYTRHVYNQQLQGDFLDVVFKGEPQKMYTNIENGYGIFAGYQETTLELKYTKSNN